MKSLFLIFFCFLLHPVCNGQQTYTVSEGELQFIHPEKGIVIKKNDSFFRLDIKVDFVGTTQKISSVVSPVKDEDVKILSKKQKVITYAEIDGSYDFKKLQNLQFIYEEDTSHFYKLFQFNPNYFAIFRNEQQEGETYSSLDEFMPYIFIQFGKKKIIYTYDNEQIYLVPTKNKINLLEQYSNSNAEWKMEKLVLTNKEVHNFSVHTFSDLKETFFKIDTLPNKKVVLKNSHNETLISKSYDSITLGYIIRCYDNGTIDLYNLTFKKLNKTKVKAVKLYRGSMQIIENNRLKLIDFTGTEIKKTIDFGIVLLDAPERNYFYEVSIKKQPHFMLKVRNFDDFGKENSNTTSDSISLRNTENIKEFYFKNQSTDTINRPTNFTESYLFDKKARITEQVNFDYEIIWFLHNDGTLGMNYLGYFLNPNFDSHDFSNYQKLQSVSYKYPYYKIRKNDLYQFYPLQKEFRYKKLDDFQGNFARFELPNGQKGWLSLDGKEYKD